MTTVEQFREAPHNALALFFALEFSDDKVPNALEDEGKRA